jgi:hypothetical protein
MRRLAAEATWFLFWLGVLLAARLALVAVAVLECAGMMAVCVCSVGWWKAYGRPAFLLLPLVAVLLASVQWALWQYACLRLARRGGRWRAMGEYFAVTLRVPVVRTPHPWE